jgi:light-regulated signal transduction histidine kinase (bacteriophytochrome)
LLQLSRISRVDLCQEQVDLSAMARLTLDRLRESDPARQVTVEVADGLTAQGDAHLLSLALENLLGNAWKFTAREPQASIIFACQRSEDGRTVYYVRDNGAGFDMAYADQIFAAFQRLHHEQEFGGTGIGLATVQRVIHRHGGQVWAQGQVGKGATFYFTLPGAEECCDDGKDFL